MVDLKPQSGDDGTAKNLCVVCGGLIYVAPSRENRRKLAARHRKCILPYPPAVCPICEKSFNPDPEQRRKLRRGGQPNCGKRTCREKWNALAAARAHAIFLRQHLVKKGALNG